MLLAQQVLKKGIDMHCPHPPLQSNGVLLYFLYRLAFGDIGRLDTEILGELAPCLDLFGIEFDDQLPQGIYFEFFVVASGRRVELRTECGSVNVEVKMRIAIENERYVGVGDGVSIDICCRQGPVSWTI